MVSLMHRGQGFISLFSVLNAIWLFLFGNTYQLIYETGVRQIFKKGENLNSW